jgi:hypothetical protein
MSKIKLTVHISIAEPEPRYIGGAGVENEVAMRCGSGIGSTKSGPYTDWEQML